MASSRSKSGISVEGNTHRIAARASDAAKGRAFFLHSSRNALMAARTSGGMLGDASVFILFPIKRMGILALRRIPALNARSSKWNGIIFPNPIALFQPSPCPRPVMTDLQLDRYSFPEVVPLYPIRVRIETVAIG
jgi:hypothetical protein